MGDESSEKRECVNEGEGMGKHEDGETLRQGSGMLAGFVFVPLFPYFPVSLFTCTALPTDPD